MLRCAISNTIPGHPVVGVTTGLVYERSLIEKALDENDGKCPVTNLSLKRSDLIDIKTDQPPINPPRSIEGTSIPSLLVAFQNEWDATALEMFKLRQTLDKTRKELAQALYQHDAACRVIARLAKERDEARNALGMVSANPSAGSSTKSDGDSLAVKPLSEAEQKKILETADSLTTSRSAKRKTMTGSQENLAWKPHSLFKGAKSATCLDLIDGEDGAALGHKDGLVKLLIRSTGKIAEKHQVGQSEISAVRFIKNSNRSFVASSLDGHVHVVAAKGRASLSLGSPVTSCCIHATQEYGFATAQSGVWSFFRLETGEAAIKGDSSGPLLSISSHPDGRVFALGGKSDGAVAVWDLMSASSQAELSSGDRALGPATHLSFGENGVSLAVGFANKGVVKIWDMRKVESAVHTFAPKTPSNIRAVSFDPSGQTLLCAFESGSITVRNVLRTGAWPTSFDSSHDAEILQAVPGVGSCLTLDVNGIVTEWR